MKIDYNNEFKAIKGVFGIFIVIILAIVMLYVMDVQQSKYQNVYFLNSNNNYNEFGDDSDDSNDNYTTEYKAMIKLEIANDTETKRIGLSETPYLSINRGMIFYVNDTGQFHMKGMQFPLEIIFISKSNVILSIKEMNVCQDQTQCESYVPVQGTYYAIEVNQNYTKEKGIEVGDEISFVHPNSIQ